MVPADVRGLGSYTLALGEARDDVPEARVWEWDHGPAEWAPGSPT